jgi:hypothetical protein
VGDHCCTPTKALSASIFMLQKSRRFRHIIFGTEVERVRPAVPCASRAGKGAHKDSRASRPRVQPRAVFRRPRAVTSPCVSKSSQP